MLLGQAPAASASPWGIVRVPTDEGHALHSGPVRVLSVILVGFLVLIQGQLWFGKGSLPYGAKLRGDLAQALSENDTARARNTQLQAELRDLKEGQEMVEEKARMELGMIRPDEIYVQVRR